MRVRVGSVGLLACAALCGCGGSPPNSLSSPSTAEPAVFAASSLSRVLPQIYPHARYTFGGSGALATEIEQGAPADVFVSASPKQPAALLKKGLIALPVKFATNTLVLLVPAGNPAKIASVEDLTRPGVKLVVCAATVPCGEYARKAMMRLGIAKGALRNVVSDATDVTQVLAQVALGQADAGFVYITDARTAGPKVKVIALPAGAKPRAEDLVAIVSKGSDQAGAHALVAALLSRAGQAKLRAAGFGAP